MPKAKKATKKRKAKVSGTKKASPRAGITAAIKAVKNGGKGSVARLNKAISSFAAKSCRAKSKKK